MEVRLEGGVVVDLATRSDHERATGRLASLLERPHSKFERIAAGKAPRAGNLIFALSLGKPSTGTLWKVQWIVLTGDDPTAAAAIANVRAALFAGSCPPDSQLPVAGTAGLDTAGCMLTGLAVPSTTAVAEMSVVYSNEELYVIFAGTGTVAGAASYHATVGVLVLPQTPGALTW